MPQLSFLKIIDNPDLASRIFSHLCREDFLESQLVCKQWAAALSRFQFNSYHTITPELVIKLKSNNQDLAEFLKENHKHGIHRLSIEGWTKQYGHLSSEFYDNFLRNPPKIRKLILKRRGLWDSCVCPKETKTNNGTLFDNVSDDQKTSIEVLIVDECFSISACALIDLISRSPKLRSLTFLGRLRKTDHCKPFSCKLLHSNITKIFWPYPTKKHNATLNFIAKQNSNIETLHSSMETVCDLLSGDLLLNLKNLSINLSEDWTCAKGEHKRAYTHLERTKYLGLAKKVESLQVRTFDLEEPCKDDEKTSRNVENIFENYKLSFWEQVADLTNLKYLAVFGAWDLENICSSLAKHCFGIEYFRTNCLPQALMEALDDQNDCPVLSMTEAIKNMRKVTSLRSLYFQCNDKLGNIDPKTILSLKELIDIIWSFDIKTRYTLEVEEFLNALIKRGNQSGKLYQIDLHIQPRDPSLADILVERPLRLPTNSNVKNYINSLAEAATKERYGETNFDSVQIWGIKLVDTLRDRNAFEQTKLAWRYHEDSFQAWTYGC